MRKPWFVFVFAGSAEECEAYRLQKGFTLEQVRYVRQPEDFRDWTFDSAIQMPLVGSYWERWDSVLLVDAARAHGIEPVPHNILTVYDPRNVSQNISRYL